jgi:hypothetical protein
MGLLSMVHVGSLPGGGSWSDGNTITAGSQVLPRDMSDAQIRATRLGKARLTGFNA